MTILFQSLMDAKADLERVPASAMRTVREKTQEGLSGREEAEFLFILDRLGHIAGDDWLPVAVNAVRDLIVWDGRPTGRVTEEDADWLIGLIGDRPTAFGRAVVFAVVRDAETAPARLSELAMRAAVGRCLLV